MKWLNGLAVFLFLFLMFTYKTTLIQTFDQNGIIVFESVRTGIGNTIFKSLSKIGSFTFLLPIAVLVTIVLLFQKRFMAAIFVQITFWSSRLLNEVLKQSFDRERPSIHPLIHVEGYSFPSGHAMNNASFYFFILYLLSSASLRSHMITRTVSFFLLLLVLFISLSRVYLGVHYPTDIIAGILAGFLLSSFAFFFYRVLKEKWKS